MMTHRRLTSCMVNGIETLNRGALATALVATTFFQTGCHATSMPADPSALHAAHGGPAPELGTRGGGAIELLRIDGTGAYAFGMKLPALRPSGSSTSGSRSPRTGTWAPSSDAPLPWAVAQRQSLSSPLVYLAGPRPERVPSGTGAIAASPEGFPEKAAHLARALSAWSAIDHARPEHLPRPLPDTFADPVFVTDALDRIERGRTLAPTEEPRMQSVQDYLLGMQAYATHDCAAAESHWQKIEERHPLDEGYLDLALPQLMAAAQMGLVLCKIPSVQGKAREADAWLSVWSASVGSAAATKVIDGATAEELVAMGQVWVGSSKAVDPSVHELSKDKTFFAALRFVQLSPPARTRGSVSTTAEDEVAKLLPLLR